MALTLDIDIQEQSDGESFMIYDKTDWTEVTGFDHTLLTNVDLTVTYDGTDYTYELVDDGGEVDEIGLTANFDNIFGTGTGEGAGFEVTPSNLSMSDSNYTDGYYSIKLEITYNTTAYSDTTSEGFLAHTECKATQLPLLLDMDNLDYDENRLQYMIIAMLSAAKDAAEMSRQTQFEEKLETINNLLSARDLDDCW